MTFETKTLGIVVTEYMSVDAGFVPSTVVKPVLEIRGRAAAHSVEVALPPDLGSIVAFEACA